MTPGSNPLPPLAGPETASAPLVNPPPTSGDSPSQAIARALNQPVRVYAIDEEEGRALLVEPLHFHRVMRRHGRDVVCKSHVHGGIDA